MSLESHPERRDTSCPGCGVLVIATLVPSHEVSPEHVPPKHTCPACREMQPWEAFTGGWRIIDIELEDDDVPESFLPAD
jgi:hypothetical protein